MRQRILPPAKIGIIGGGQLGQMIALSAIEMGYRVAVLDPDPFCPCACLAQPFIKADYTDVVALAQLVELCDVVTYEFENADSALIDGFNINGKIPQGALALTLSQHRLKEKAFAEFLEIPCPKYWPVLSQKELLKLNDFPLIIKSCRYGYDGKHQYIIRTKEDLKALKLEFPSEYIAEKLITFEKEISVVAACFKDGISLFEPFENVHVNGILSTSRHPALISPQLQRQALETTEKIAHALDYIGVLAVEYFISSEGLLFNEMAPRPHNSAHGTIEGCTFSQFDLHVLSITGSSLVQTRRSSLTMMINILGQDLPLALKKFSKCDPNETHLHLYGKKEARENRKVGHVTLCAATLNDLQKDINDWRNNS